MFTLFCSTSLLAQCEVDLGGNNTHFRLQVLFLQLNRTITKNLLHQIPIFSPHLLSHEAVRSFAQAIPYIARHSLFVSHL